MTIRIVINKLKPKSPLLYEKLFPKLGFVRLLHNIEYSSTSGKIYDSYRGDGNREIEDIGDSILKRVKLIFS